MTPPTTTTAQERVFVDKFSISRIQNAVLGDKHGDLMHVYSLESHQLKWKYLSTTFWVSFLFFFFFWIEPLVAVQYLSE